jgi:hypothetical protein
MNETLGDESRQETADDRVFQVKMHDLIRHGSRVIED